MNVADTVLGTYPSWSHLIVRVALGITFFAHGAQKVFGWYGGPGLKNTIATFKQYMGIPPAATVAAASVECFGGLLMIAGILARPVALAMIVVMVVAAVKVHVPHGFFLNFQSTPGKGHGFEYNFVLAAMALSILIGGAGVLSIDRALWRTID
jgi:putative oxidoreductase